MLKRKHSFVTWPIKSDDQVRASYIPTASRPSIDVGECVHFRHKLKNRTTGEREWLTHVGVVLAIDKRPPAPNVFFIAWGTGSPREDGDRLLVLKKSDAGDDMHLGKNTNFYSTHFAPCEAKFLAPRAGAPPEDLLKALRLLVGIPQ